MEGAIVGAFGGKSVGLFVESVGADEGAVVGAFDGIRVTDVSK